MSGIASEENHVTSLSVFVSVVAGRSAASPAPEVRTSLCPLPTLPMSQGRERLPRGGTSKGSDKDASERRFREAA